jgi:2-polyprenyl-3-methyl-5-hydroxy-6-metoxy-1,4-benzoquinol methylase
MTRATNASEIRRRKAEIEREHGPWTATNIELGHGIYTIDAGYVSGDRWRVRQVLQIASDATGKPLSELRVLDLASQEGMFSLEFALHGASVTGVEIRDAHVAKAEFAREVLGLESVDFRLGDVRDVGRDTYGSFDVILCLGILYHLDAADAIRLVKRMAEMCHRCVIIDTHVSVRDAASYDTEGRRYWGLWYREHDQDDSPDMKEARPWSSIDNPHSFWFTLPSLLNLATHAGFTSAYECQSPPAFPGNYADRVMLLTMKGEIQRALTHPAGADDQLDSREHAPFILHPIQRPLLGRSSMKAWAMYGARVTLRRVPPAARRRLRSVSGARIR